ncbi:MAG: histidine phosphatase family protein [Dehalococcoidia bacterium]
MRSRASPGRRSASATRTWSPASASARPSTPPGRVRKGEVFRDRVCAALWELEERHKDETVAVVAHAGPVLVFCLSVLDMPYKRPMPFACDNASVTSVLVRDGRASILSVNDTCHLQER